MSKDWDFYTRRVSAADERPALIFIDLGIAAEAPLATHPISGFVQVPFLQPDARGQAPAGEGARLHEIELRLHQHLSQARNTAGAVYVGRSTGVGACIFYYYLCASHGFAKRVTEVSAAVPEYSFATFTRSDPQWSVYAQMLPDRLARAQIASRRNLRALAETGDDLSQARLMQHWAVFPSPAARLEFVRSTMLMGFKRGYSSDGDTFGVQITRMDVPELQRLERLINSLAQLAHASGGTYEGWEAGALT